MKSRDPEAQDLTHTTQHDREGAGVTMQKPEAQTLGVSGIEPKPVNTPDQGANWPEIAALPPFQMFLAEKHPETQRGDSYLNAIEMLQQRHDDGLLEEYETWHKAKGYWPNESPTGELLAAR